MIAYFADRASNIIGHAGSRLKKGLCISEDSEKDTLENGAKTFEFYLNYAAGQHERAKELCQAGNYIFLDPKTAYTIVSTEDDSDNQQIEVYAEDAGLEMISGVVGQIKLMSNISDFAKLCLRSTDFELGVNEIDNDVKKDIEWDDYATIVERLLDVAGQFDAEMSYSYEFERMKVVKKYVNFYKHRGAEKPITLHLGKEVSNIIEKKSVENLATALMVSGGTPDDADDPIGLGGLTYDDGDIYLDGSTLYCRSALKRWQKTSTHHILREYTSDTLDQQELLDEAVKELRKASDIETTYDIDVELYDKMISAGDTVKVVDSDGDVYISARAQTVDYCRSEGKQKLTLGETVSLNNATQTGSKTGKSSEPTVTGGFTIYGEARKAVALSTTETLISNHTIVSDEYYDKTAQNITVKQAGRYLISVNASFTGTGNVHIAIKSGNDVLQQSDGYVSTSGSVAFSAVVQLAANVTLTFSETCDKDQTVSDSGNSVVYLQKLA